MATAAEEALALKDSMGKRDSQTLGLMRRLPMESIGKVHEALQTLEACGLTQLADAAGLLEGVNDMLLRRQPGRAKATGFGAWIAMPEERGITVRQLQDVYAIIEETCSTWAETSSQGENPKCGSMEVNVYQTVEHMVKPRTKSCQCSYVELVAKGPQVPIWFVSYWSGEPVVDLLDCLEYHLKLRRLNMESPYWLHAFAANHWSAEETTSVSPKNTSLLGALQRCIGTIIIVDKDATAFRRLWCCFEVAATLQSAASLLDVALRVSSPQGGKAAILTDGLTIEDEEEGKKYHWESRGGAYGHKLEREKLFPEDVVRKAWRVTLEEGSASRDEDRIRILNSIAGRKDEELDAEPDTKNAHYDSANRRLRWRLGVAYLHVAAELGREDLVKESLAESDRIVEEHAVDLVTKAYDDLYRALYARSKYALAMAILDKLCPIQTKSLGHTHADVGTTLNNIAMVYAGQCKHDLAVEYFIRALTIMEAALGRFHPDIGNTLSNLATVYFQQSKLDVALEHFKRAVAIREAALGESDPSVGSALNNIAMVYARQSKFDLAIEHYEKALNIREAALGKSHPRVGDTLNNIAVVYCDQSKLDLAVEYFQKSLTIMEAAFGQSHPQVGETLSSIAAVYKCQSKTGSAEQMYRRAAAAYQASYGGDHSKTLAALQQASDCKLP